MSQQSQIQGSTHGNLFLSPRRREQAQGSPSTGHGPDLGGRQSLSRRQPDAQLSGNGAGIGIDRPEPAQRDRVSDLQPAAVEAEQSPREPRLPNDPTDYGKPHAGNACGCEPCASGSGSSGTGLAIGSGCPSSPGSGPGHSAVVHEAKRPISDHDVKSWLSKLITGSSDTAIVRVSRQVLGVPAAIRLFVLLLADAAEDGLESVINDPTLDYEFLFVRLGFEWDLIVRILNTLK